MIIEYEAALLNWFKFGVKGLNKIEYVVDNYTSLLQLSPVLEYPSVIIKRKFENGDVSTKSIDIESGPNSVTKYFVFLVTYAAFIFCEKAKDTMNLMVKMRWYTEQCPYNYVTYGGRVFPIGMRFQYITMEEEEDGDSKKGARRAVGLVWQSSIPICATIEHPEIISFRINFSGVVEGIDAEGNVYLTKQTIVNNYNQ